MKKVLSLLLLFLIMFNTMIPSMAVYNMHNENVSKLSEETEIQYLSGYTLLKSGNTNEFLDPNRIISKENSAKANEIYYFKNLSAKYGNCFYVIYDSNDEVINYLRATEETTGEVIESIRVIMPENTAYFRVACDLNVNNEMFEILKSDATINEKRKEQPAVITFIDDDCRKEVATVLYPLIKNLNIPYTLACPPNNLGKEDYLAIEDFKTIVNNTDGVDIDIISHHYTETKMTEMTEFENIVSYEKDTKNCLTWFKNNGIEVNGVAYPNGAIHEEYMPVVEENFELGFTTDRGINTLPYESYYIDRCEVFPQNGKYNIGDAIDLVDSVIENGGWLVFMTHCWYEQFSPKEFEELIEHIETKNKENKDNKSKQVEILNVSDVIEKYGNAIDMGIMKKKLENMSDDFFVMDYLGRAYTNNVEFANLETKDMEIIDKSTINWKEISLNYNTGLELGPDGYQIDYYQKASTENRKVTNEEKKKNVIQIEVTPNTIYRLENLSAQDGNCFYVIYDSNWKVLDCKKAPELLTGNVLNEIILTIPNGAAYLRIACDLNIKDRLFKVHLASEITKPEEVEISYHKGYTLFEKGIQKDTDSNKLISERIPVDSDSVYHFKNLSAGNKNCFYVIYDSNCEVIEYLEKTEKITDNNIENIRVIMPKNAAYIRVACDLNTNNIFKLYCTNIKNVDNK